LSKLTHVNGAGKARMVDVGEKTASRRRAIASARVRMSGDTLDAVRENTLGKGEVLNVARVAGILAAKQVDRLIPLAHPLPLEFVGVEFEFQKDALLIRAEACVEAKTGVEMEALTAATVAALTVYDMAKAMDRGMEITDVRLEGKSGGLSGDFQRSGDAPGTQEGE
jgi:cyclic pyranopterin phosphate synthase